MSIERLQQAARAAGYAMAAPDDDSMDTVPTATQKQPGTSVALLSSESHASAGASPDIVTTGATWLKNLLPAGISGRATA